METHARSIAKAITYRLAGTLLTILVAWAWTGRIGLAAQIGIADCVVKIGGFYLHERLWDKIALGRRQGPEYEI